MKAAVEPTELVGGAGRLNPAQRPVPFHLLRWGRLVGLGLAGVLTALTPSAATGIVALVALGAYLLLRHAVRREDRVTAVLDTAAVGAAIAITGGAGSPYTVLGAVVAGGAGVTAGFVPGTLAGGLLALLGLLQQVVAGGVLGAQTLVALVALYPLAGLAGAMGEHMSRPMPRPARAALSEAAEVLSSLHRVAAEIPGGLNLRSVAATALGELHEQQLAPAGMVLVSGGGLLHPAATFGVPAAEGLSLPVSRAVCYLAANTLRPAVRQAALPRELRPACAEHERWFVRNVGTDRDTPDLLLVAAPTDGTAHILGGALDELATDTRLALANARSFARIQALAADHERRRLAHDLHDGIAQSLAHIRLELELLSRRSDLTPASARTESERLARIVHGTLSEVRGITHGLRTSALDQGLVGALQSHLADLRGLVGPELVFETTGQVVLDDEAQETVFRIGQEAISNAVRHGAPKHVTVTVEADATALSLVVEDDGRGRNAPSVAAGSGLGIQGMHARAHQLGGHLIVRDRLGGGTVVDLTVPTRGVASPEPVRLVESSEPSSA